MQIYRCDYDPVTTDPSARLACRKTARRSEVEDKGWIQIHLPENGIGDPFVDGPYEFCSVEHLEAFLQDRTRQFNQAIAELDVEEAVSS